MKFISLCGKQYCETKFHGESGAQQISPCEIQFGCVKSDCRPAVMTALVFSQDSQSTADHRSELAFQGARAEAFDACARLDRLPVCLDVLGNKRTAMKDLVAAAMIGPPMLAGAANQAVEVYKSATRGCCEEWVKHLRANQPPRRN